MQERTRYRVTGSLFLLALAVIFLPMLFDGRGEPVPAMPARPAPESPPDLPDFEEIVPASDVVERAEALQAEVDEGGFSTSSGTRFGEPVLTLDQTPPMGVLPDGTPAPHGKVDLEAVRRAQEAVEANEELLGLTGDFGDPGAVRVRRIRVTN